MNLRSQNEIYADLDARVQCYLEGSILFSDEILFYAHIVGQHPLTLSYCVILCLFLFYQGVTNAIYKYKTMKLEAHSHTSVAIPHLLIVM